MPSHTPDGRMWYGIDEACAALNVSRRTMYNWLQRGLIETRRTPSGGLRIAADSLWKESRRPHASA